MKPTPLAKFLSFCITHHFPVLLKGRPGIGKSDMVEQAARAANAKLIISHPVVSDPTDYKGLPFAKDDTMAYFLPYGDLHQILHAQEETIFFLDDLGQATPAVQAACMQLILARQINGHRVSDKVTFIAATNRKEDKAGVSGILEPLKSRFTSIIELEVGVDDWVKWALKNDMPVELIGFIQAKPDYIEKFEPNKDIVNSASPRTVAYVGYMQNKQLPAELEFEAFKGAGGEAFAIEYRDFLKVQRKLPPIDQIILSPANAIVPTAPDLLYTLSYALGRKATPLNFPAVITYLKRLPIEYAAASIKGATDRDPDLCNTHVFQQWASDNSGVFN